MAGYSKEAERQNKALGNLLKGQEVEKRSMVGYEGKQKEKGDDPAPIVDPDERKERIARTATTMEEAKAGTVPDTAKIPDAANCQSNLIQI